MKIYEIDQAIEQLIADSIDQETGETNLDLEALDALQLERGKAVENLALYFKNLMAEAEAIKAEEDKLKKRRESTLKTAERVESYLTYVLQGEKFKTPRVVVGYRTSSSVEVGDGFVEWAAKNAPNLLRTTTKTEPDKAAIKDALKNGEDVKCAAMISKTTMSIK